MTATPSTPTERAADIAQKFGISKRTVYRLAAEGRIPGYRVGGQLRFSSEEIREHLRTQIEAA